MKKLLFLFVLFNSAVVGCLAQDDFASVKANANACELNSLHLDRLRSEIANNPTARIIAKFNVGKGESLSIGEKRTSYIRKFLEQNKGFDLSSVEFVNAGKLETDENPKTEFYIVQAGETEGKLFLVTYAQPNKTPCLDCCEEGFYPKNLNPKPKPKKKTTKKQRKRRK